MAGNPNAALPTTAELPSASSRDIALREADHRIKNHLQLLAAYARMASRRRGLTAAELAEDLADKLLAIAGAHDALHRDGEAGLCPARTLIETLVAAFAGSPHRITVDCAPELQLPADEAAPIGMIVNEAISNAMKHAFPAGREGRIWVRLADEGGRIRLSVRDDGMGIGDVAASDGRGGAWLIRVLAEQLGGFARLGSAPFGGGSVTVVYPRPLN